MNELTTLSTPSCVPMALTSFGRSMTPDNVVPFEKTLDACCSTARAKPMASALVCKGDNP